MKIKLECKNLRKLEPVSEKYITRYVGYIKTSSFLNYKKELEEEWMALNPRFQKTTTEVAKKIKSELLSDSELFHIKNKGILFSANSVEWDSKTEELIVEFNDPEVHGNIDGGHTLKIILECRDSVSILDKKWVFVEILTNIISRFDAIDISVARNSAISVDTKSQSHMLGHFKPLEEIIDKEFLDKVYFKMNEEHVFKESKTIDVRVIIAILNMFYLDFYPNDLGSSHPIQSYTGKEVSLGKYLNLTEDKQKDYAKKISKVANDIFRLHDLIETSFPNWVDETSSLKYSSFEYAKAKDFELGKLKLKSLFKNIDLKAKVPSGILYPILASMRALIKEENGYYQWTDNPFEVIEANKKHIVHTILESNEKNPEYIGKSNNIWSNLFNIALIVRFQKEKNNK